MTEQRLQAFEAMLEEIQRDYDFKTSEIEKLKLQGKEKTVTFKQYLADKMLYQCMLSLYERHGLF